MGEPDEDGPEPDECPNCGEWLPIQPTRIHTYKQAIPTDFLNEKEAATVRRGETIDTYFFEYDCPNCGHTHTAQTP